jgi:Fe-S cluster biogenesis protein NfuA
MSHLRTGDFEDRVYKAVEEAQERLRAEDRALLVRENFPFLDDTEYAEMLEHLADTYKGVEVEHVDPYLKTVELRPEGGCSACGISTFHIREAIGSYLIEHVDPELRVIVKSSPEVEY